jgi:hypothetical protein
LAGQSDEFRRLGIGVWLKCNPVARPAGWTVTQPTVAEVSGDDMMIQVRIHLRTALGWATAQGTNRQIFYPTAQRLAHNALRQPQARRQEGIRAAYAALRDK